MVQEIIETLTDERNKIDTLVVGLKARLANVDDNNDTLYNELGAQICLLNVARQGIVGVVHNLERTQ